jgi:hypothetical protein
MLHQIEPSHPLQQQALRVLWRHMVCLLLDLAVAVAAAEEEVVVVAAHPQRRQEEEEEEEQEVEELQLLHRQQLLVLAWQWHGNCASLTQQAKALHHVQHPRVATMVVPHHPLQTLSRCLAVCFLDPQHQKRLKAVTCLHLVRRC